MRLKNLVQIDNRFEKSVNLLLDLNDKKKIASYIPTRSSINLIEDYMKEVTGFSGGRANILIGPYGKGKSHLLLVLMEILCGRESEELEYLIEKISTIDKQAGKTFREVNRSYKFLPVIINTTSGNLGQAFVRSLNQAIKRVGLQDIVPDNYFSEAVATIKQWKKRYPATYASMEKLIGESGSDFIKKLEAYDYDALEKFRKNHPLVTSGSEFNPLIDDEAISVYRSVNRMICEKYHYSGIYIIFDEFSKYIEGHSEEGFSADMKLLQDICELCNYSRDEQLHLTCVAHKAIRAYGDALSRSIMNAFRGVEGRLIEVSFNVSSQNNYELIADAINKRHEFQQWKRNIEHVNLLEESYQIPEFKTLFNKNDFDEIVGNGCFPLTPLGTCLLLNLSEKIAQNERTIFTFLSGKDIHSLSAFVANSEAVSYAGASLIYDYFMPLFEGEKRTIVHSEWLRAELALSKTEELEERAVIKSIAIIRMINREDDIPVNRNIVRLASGIDKKTFEKAMDSLVNKGIIAYKKSTATYDFQNKIGVNVENEIADCALKYFSKVDVPEVLNDVCRKRYILPKKYNQDHFMTRYYRVLFMSAESFMALSSPDYLSDENNPDGFLIIIQNSSVAQEALQAHLNEIAANCIMLGIPEIRDEDLENNVRTLLAVRRLMGDTNFIAENEVLVKELKAFEAEMNDSLNEWINNAENELQELFAVGRRISVERYGLNRAVSDFCEEVYSKTPKINQELINRHNISAQVSKARNTIMDDILHNRSMDKYNTGTSAESTIYRGLFLHTEDDENLKNVREEILEFIHESKGKKVPFSKLINKLISEPYGMRKGPIPVYILESLTKLEDMPVIYLGKKELSIDSSLMSNVMQNPEDYALYVEEETGQKLEYIEGLENLFNEYGTYCRDLEARNRLSKLTCVMQSWYRSLPQTATTFKKGDFNGLSIREIDLFRRCLSGSINPREALFDQFPKIFGETSLPATLREIRKVKAVLDQHIHELKLKAVDVIRNNLSLSKEDDLHQGIKAWYTGLPEVIKNSVLTADSQRLLLCLKNLDETNPEDIAEKTSKEVTGFFIEDWNDNSIKVYEAGFSDLIDEINERTKRKDTDSGQSIVFSTDSGVKECLYKFDPDNITPNGYFFRNALEDIMEEYGDSLETNEKIGILMQVIKDLMG